MEQRRDTICHKWSYQNLGGALYIRKHLMQTKVKHFWLSNEMVKMLQNKGVGPVGDRNDRSAVGDPRFGTQSGEFARPVRPCRRGISGYRGSRQSAGFPAGTGCRTIGWVSAPPAPVETAKSGSKTNQ
jgi:hypothetical protein